MLSLYLFQRHLKIICRDGSADSCGHYTVYRRPAIDIHKPFEEKQFSLHITSPISLPQYLNGLRETPQKRKVPITVTECEPDSSASIMMMAQKRSNRLQYFES